MQISRLQYITNYQSETSHLNQVKEVVKAGIKWIQFRPKESDKATILNEGNKIAEFCKQHSVVFIMNDSVDFAVKLNADGVHLGKNDMSPKEARKILGDNKIIGGTSNTAVDIVDLINQGVNYVGLGPFKFTKTKKNLSPVLGINGYNQIIDALKEKGCNIPVIAIGGIKEEDIIPLQNTGIHGVAISSLISEAESISPKTKEILNLINSF
jgi:thiamine-phosphate pyrophosphorylase